jgi:hypothetical protein
VLPELSDVAWRHPAKAAFVIKHGERLGARDPRLNPSLTITVVFEPPSAQKAALSLGQEWLDRQDLQGSWGFKPTQVDFAVVLPGSLIAKSTAITKKHRTGA